MPISDPQTYHTHGYLIVKNLFSPTEIATLSRIVDRIFSQWLAENRDRMIANRLVNMYSLTDPRYFQEQVSERVLLFQTLASQALVSLLAQLFGDEVYFHNTQLFFNPFDSDQQPYWHRDMQYSSIADAVLQAEQSRILALHVRVPLLAEQGIELIPGTHRRWDDELEREVRLELNGHKNSEDLPGAVTIDLQPGDILLFDAQMLHRGCYRSNPARKALDLCVGNYHPYTAAYLWESNLPTAEEMAQISHSGWYRNAWKIAAAHQNADPF